MSIPGKEGPGTGAGGGQCGIATVGCSWTEGFQNTDFIANSLSFLRTFAADRFRKTQNYAQTKLVLPYLLVNNSMFYL